MAFSFIFCILAIFSGSLVECRLVPKNRQAVASPTTAAYGSGLTTGPTVGLTSVHTTTSAYTATTPKASPPPTASVSVGPGTTTPSHGNPITTYAAYSSSGSSGSGGPAGGGSSGGGSGGSGGSSAGGSSGGGSSGGGSSGGGSNGGGDSSGGASSGGGSSTGGSSGGGSSGGGSTNGASGIGDADPFLFPHPGPAANPTTTPSPNNAVFTSQSTRPPCSGNSGKTCDPTGGPGLDRQPNILIFICDDLGSSDLSYKEGNLQTPTPNIDKLAWDGIILNRHYSNALCTPTRAAFMTGKYVFRIGMQTRAISQGEPWGVPLQLKFSPQYFKDLGYNTWGTGKWHLGDYNRPSLPGSRGFDESYMITAGDANWFNYTTGWITPLPTEGRLLRQNNKMVFANITNNNYLPELFTTVAEKWIRNSNPNNPFWLYFATTAVHSAFEPYGAVMHTMPQYQLRPSAFSFTDKYPMRKKQLALVQVLDESFKRLVDALTYKGIINNTIIVVFGDNGGPIPSVYAFIHGTNWGSNWPLRQGKGSMFEGGVRTDSFIWSPLLPKRGRITEQLFHVTDWLPTLYEAAGGDVNQLGDHPGDLSGVSQWKSLYNGLNYGPRTEIVLNIDSMDNQSAIIYQDSYGGIYKLLKGNVFDNVFTGWFRTPGTSDADPQTVWTPTAVKCNFPPGVEVSACKSIQSDCLFDLVNDPCETNNIAASYPSMVELLNKKIIAYNATSIPSAIKPYDPASFPGLWDGQWAPWKSEEVLDAVPLTFMPFNPSDSY